MKFKTSEGFESQSFRINKALNNPLWSHQVIIGLSVVGRF